jgi:hypothetical protein
LEPIGNFKGTKEKRKKNPLPSPLQNLKGKNSKHFECMLRRAIWLHEISISKKRLLITIFGLG